MIEYVIDTNRSFSIRDNLPVHHPPIMSGNTKHRGADNKKPLLDVQRKPVGARTKEEQYSPAGRKSWMSTLIWAPADVEVLKVSNTLRAYFMEFLGTLLFTLATNMAVSLTAAASTTLLNGVLVGLLAGGSYYMAGSWLRTTSKDESDYELPRHLSWSVSLGHFLVMRLGLWYLLWYLVAQTAGAAVAGGFLYFFDNGVVPSMLSATPNNGFYWALEILGPLFIVFSVLYNNYLSRYMDKKGSPSEEDSIHHGMYAGGLMRFVWTAIFYNKGAYSFDAVVYIAGVIGTCATACLGSSGNGWWFYVFVPLLGSVGAAIVYVPPMLLFSWGRSEREMRRHKQRGAGENE
jgi:glycerol uptake facilitator-like aquaporin